MGEAELTDNQIIYSVRRLLANPKVWFAIANYFDGPNAEILSSAFFDLLEAEILETEDQEQAEFSAAEVCIREKPDSEIEGTFQVILSTGSTIELRPTEGELYAAVMTEDDLGAVSAIYGRLVQAIEEAKPELKGDIALCEPPTPGNGFLRDENGNAFRGRFHLLSDPETIFGFVVDVIDLEKDDLRARIEP